MVALHYPLIYGRSASIHCVCTLRRIRPVPLSDNLLHQIITHDRSATPACESFWLCNGGVVLWIAGAQRICAMIETVTAVMGLVSAGIFLAHAFEGYRSRAWVLNGWRFGHFARTSDREIAS
jgi:hypothetical protein